MTAGWRCAEDSEAFQQRDQDLRAAVAAFQQRWEAAEAELPLHPARRKVLSSLREHRPGLTLFVEHPEIPMDNNTVERTLREPVVGRKNYAGSRSLVEWPVAGADAVAAGDAEVAGFEPPALLDGLPGGWRCWRMRTRRALSMVALEPVGRTAARLGQPPAFHDSTRTKRATNQEVAGRDKCPGMPGGRRSGRETARGGGQLSLRVIEVILLQPLNPLLIRNL